MKETFLELKDVHISYGQIKAIHGISLKVKKGDIVTLLGSNGAGKTTTLRAISGLVPVAQGEIIFKGERINGLTPHKIVARGLTQSPEGRLIFPDLTVLENLEMGHYLRSDKVGIKEDLEYIFDLFPRLKERQKQLAGTLSGGEQQFLAIGRAYMGSPELLLLDEPSLGIAPLLVRAIFKAISEINKRRGTTILLVEQNAYAALKIANFGLVLKSGQIILTGTGAELLNNEDVQKAYLGH